MIFHYLQLNNTSIWLQQEQAILFQWYLHTAIFSLPTHCVGTNLCGCSWAAGAHHTRARDVGARAKFPSGPNHPTLVGFVAAPAVQVQFKLGCVGWSSKPWKNGAGDFLELIRNLGHCGVFCCVFSSVSILKAQEGKDAPLPDGYSQFATG